MKERKKKDRNKKKKREIYFTTETIKESKEKKFDGRQSKSKEPNTPKEI